jgi:hypothetical protein
MTRRYRRYHLQIRGSGSTVIIIFRMIFYIQYILYYYYGRIRYIRCNNIYDI